MQTPDPILVEAAGSSVAVRRIGKGPAIVCLHATGHDGLDYSRLAERLSDRFEVILVDWPGHGASATSSGPVTAQHYADVLADVMDKLTIPHATIIGNSIGGAASIVYAAKHPDRVTSLVLCNSGGLQRVGFIARLVCRKMASFFASGERRDPAFPGRFGKYYANSVLTAPAAHWRRDEIIAHPNPAMMRQAWENFALPASDLRALTSRVTCPVLLAWAKNDRYVAWSRSKVAARSIPNHQVKLYEGSHSAFLEAPEQFERDLLAFMQLRDIR